MPECFAVVPLPTVGSSIENSWNKKMIAIAADCSTTFHDCQSMDFKSACKRLEPGASRNPSKSELEVEWHSAPEKKSIWSAGNKTFGTCNFWWWAPINARISTRRKGRCTNLRVIFFFWICNNLALGWCSESSISSKLYILDESTVGKLFSWMPKKRHPER